MQIPEISTQQRLKELRATGLTDEAIGERVGLHQSNVWRLRKGEYKGTTDVVGIRIANLHAQIVIQKNSVSQ